ALLLGPALLGDRPKIRLQRELERFRGIEQPATRRPGRVGRRLRGDGLCLEDPGRPGYDAHRRQGGQCDPGPPGSPGSPPVPHAVNAHPASLRVCIFPSRGGGVPMTRLAVLTLLAVLPAGGTAQRGDWPMPAKDYAATRYSDLTEITGANAGRLRPVWSFSTGVLGGHTVAVAAATGKELWKTKIADLSQGETTPVAPLVVKHRVIVGASGGEFGIHGWLKGLDLETGRIVWTAYNIGPDSQVLAKPGTFKPFYDRGTELALTSWPADVWKNGGAPVWGWMSYDADLDLL